MACGMTRCDWFRGRDRTRNRHPRVRGGSQDQGGVDSQWLVELGGLIRASVCVCVCVCVVSGGGAGKDGVVCVCVCV